MNFIRTNVTLPIYINQQLSQPAHPGVEHCLRVCLQIQAAFGRNNRQTTRRIGPLQNWARAFFGQKGSAVAWSNLLNGEDSYVLVRQANSRVMRTPKYTRSTSSGDVKKYHDVRNSEGAIRLRVETLEYSTLMHFHDKLRSSGNEFHSSFAILVIYYTLIIVKVMVFHLEITERLWKCKIHSEVRINTL